MNASRNARYAEFRPQTLVAALGLALTTGFAAAVVLGLALGEVVAIGPWWTAVVQAHAHAQLFGWTALFILGVGFHLLPRMRGAPLAFPSLTPWIAACVGGGVALRFVGQCALALGGPASWGVVLAASGVLQAAGGVMTIATLAATLRRGPPLASRPGMPRTLPFLAMAFLSFLAASLVAGWLAFDAGTRAKALVDPLGNRLVVELLLHGFIVPIAFGISVQTLPLFLRLPAAVTPVVQSLGVTYGVALLARVAGTALRWPSLGDLGLLLGAAVVLAFVAWHDIVIRLRVPWTAHRQRYVLGEREPMRPGMPDRGEFGRFEWLVRGAYVWLVVAAVLDALAAGGRLGHGEPMVVPDAARHALALGFVTLLIVGMAVRMIPGFAKGRLASPGAVAVLAVLGHAAALARVVPLVFPGLPAGRWALAASGALGWTLVLGLAVVLAPLLRRRGGRGQDKRETAPTGM